jgi:GNAT superfamily N-acetyltransferase
MIVHPEYQGRGIGTQILHLLVDWCERAGIRDIQLFCARGKLKFYEKNGFIPRPEDAPGMQYKRDR